MTIEIPVPHGRYEPTPGPEVTVLIIGAGNSELAAAGVRVSLYQSTLVLTKE